jgi:hypothetical protein
VISVKVKGVKEIERNLDKLYTSEDRKHDLHTFAKRGARKYRKGLGGRNNTTSAEVLGDSKMVLSTTLNQPRTKGTHWQREFVYAIYPAMSKRVFRARAKKIEERWRA